jgi:hypothetical protein
VVKKTKSGRLLFEMYAPKGNERNRRAASWESRVKLYKMKGLGMLISLLLSKGEFSDKVGLIH